jgi:predicted Zn-dependent peptidase/predicted Ser/Thr protein kinase
MRSCAARWHAIARSAMARRTSSPAICAGASAAYGEPMAPSEITAQLATWLGPSLARRRRDLAELRGETRSLEGATGEPTAPYEPPPVAGARLRERSVAVGGAAVITARSRYARVMDGCPERPNTVAYAAGELAPADAARAQLHAASCEECRSIVETAASTPMLAASGSRVRDSPLPHDGDGNGANPRTLSANDAGRPTPAPPRKMIGRHRVLTRLGAGGMGVVYAAEDPDLDRKVAIKVLHATSEHSARLVREARALAKLRHPHVITIYEVGREAQEIFVVMELVDGVTLREWLRTDRPLADKLAAMVAAGRGLAAAHAKGLVHRDFKPDNVMVGKDGRVQVLDFGLAKAASDDDDDGRGDLADGALDQLTLTGTMLGTPAYMAPEQFAAAATDARIDQFAFCVTLFEALNGHRPFDGATIGELKLAVISGRLAERSPNPDVPAVVQAALLRGLSVDPAARFPSMDALLASLEARPAPRRRWLVPAITAAAVAGIGVASFATHDRASEVPVAAPVDPVAAMLARSDLPAVQPKPLAGDPYRLTAHRLSNGLTVWISQNHKAPRIHAAFVVRAGSRDESKTTGIAHMNVHMMLMGSERIGTTDHAAEAPHLDKLRQLYAERASAPAAQREALLAQIDAETAAASRFRIPNELPNTAIALGVLNFNGGVDRDSSMFYADLPSNKLAQWAELAGEQWAAPVFRSFHAETGIVFDEIHQSAARRGELPLLDALFAELFPNHPYAHPVGGTYADIIAEPFTEAEQFHGTWYAPNNTALLLAGDIDPETAVATLDRELAKWKPHEVPPRSGRAVPAPASSITRDVRGVDATLALVGWRGPAIRDPDAIVVEVLAELLRRIGEMQEDRAKLRIEPQFYIEGGVVIASVLPAAGKSHDDGIAALDGVVTAVREGKFSQETLDAVIENFRFDNDLARDDNDQRVARMARAYLAGRSWTDDLADRGRAAKLTKAEIQRVAARYLAGPRVVIRSDNRPYQLPDVAAPNITPLELAKDAQSPFVKQLLAEETVEIPPRFVSRGRDYDVREDANGPVIAVTNIEGKDYELRLHWDAGARRVPLLCAALTALRSAGRERRERWYARVLRITFTCQDDDAEILIAGRDSDLDEGWREAIALLRGDALTDEIWRAGAASYVQERWLHNTTDIASALLDYSEFGATSPRLMLPSRDAIARATVADARAALRVLDTTRHTASYYGPRAPADVHPPSAGEVKPLPAASPPRRVPGKPPRIAVLDTGPNAAFDIAITVPLDRLDRSQLATLDLYSDYLTNWTGVLFEALRTIRSNTYAVTVSLAGRVPDDAKLVIRFSAPPAQLVETLELALATLHERTVDPQHFARARRSVEQGYRADWIAPRELPAAVKSWLRFEYDRDPRPQGFDEIVRATPHDLAALVNHVATAPLYISLSGDLRAIDRTKLARLGSVEVVERTALFVP